MGSLTRVGVATPSNLDPSHHVGLPLPLRRVSWVSVVLRVLPIAIVAIISSTQKHVCLPPKSHVPYHRTSSHWCIARCATTGFCATLPFITQSAPTHMSKQLPYIWPR